jgi:hypothetical protein
MITKKHVKLIALGACLVGLSVLGSAKNPVERPIKFSVQETLVITLDDKGFPVTWGGFGTGNCSHLGRVENRGGGTYNADGNPVGTGVLTAANGDQLFWSSADDPAITVFTGGTGRFASATGSVRAVSMEMVWRPTPPPGTLVADVRISVKGTITY